MQDMAAFNAQVLDPVDHKIRRERLSVRSNGASLGRQMTQDYRVPEKMRMWLSKTFFNRSQAQTNYNHYSLSLGPRASLRDGVTGGVVNVCLQGVCETRELDNISTKTSPEYGRGNTDYFVAANSALASMTTVAFVGAGPSSLHSAVLYVGSTYTGTTSTSVRQTVPAISSRSLNAGPGLLRFTHVDGLTGGTLVRLRSEAIEKLPVTYVAGFSAAGFAHFLTVQPEHFALENFGAPPTVSTRFSSRLVHVCQRDRGFYSYVEMPVRCSSGDVDYNLVRAATVVRPAADLSARLLLAAESGDDRKVVVAVFSRSLGEGATPSGESAVCVYRLVDVQRKFVDNLRQCFAGQQTRVGAQFGNRMCVSLVSSLCSYLQFTDPTFLAIDAASYRI